MTDILELPFDQYQRYGLVQALVESVRAPGERFRILDVGGRTALLRSFLPDDQVDLVDVDPSDVEGLVLGSGAELPFVSGAFDVVAAFDTLEHVPPALREAFVAECARVSKRYVILAGPYDSPRVAEAEEILLQFLKDRLDWEHRYLAEHRTNGLPDAAATVAGFERAGARVETFGHGALDRWLLLMSLELYIEHEGLLQGVAKRAYRLYNEHLFQSDHGDEVYRHAIVAALGGAPMPTLAGVLEPPGSAPKAATDALAEFGREVMRYDALRGTYLPELERMEAEVRSAVADVEGHRGTLAATQADLEEHKRTIAALRAELDRERAESQAVGAEQQERIGGLTADLEGHRATVRELERLRADELRELEVRGQRIGELGREMLEKDAALEAARLAALELVALRERLETVERREGELAGSLDRTAKQLRRALAAAESNPAADVPVEALAGQLTQELERRTSQLEIVRLQHAGLVAEAERLWNRIGRRVTLRRLDPALLAETDELESGA